MYLKRLEIYGFKSFADRINIEFHRGITGIVGPNGSGKSNISDAIRWVLGEQSAKSLRGSKMEDVIFSGTQMRKSLGFAEVTLVLDNSKGKLPVDFSEVAVTRRVFRSGESEYYINRSSCRLKDIVELFVDTGIGKEGYSIISQGQIAEILSTHSENRRGIFEEAAGIMKYKLRKEEAERKLDKTRENIIRVEDILAELGEQLIPLESQSRVAREYLKLKERLKYLEINRFVHQYNKYTARIHELKEQIKLLNLDIEHHKVDLKHKKEENTRMQHEIEKSRKKIEQLVNCRYDLLQQTEKAKGEVGILKEKIQQLMRDNLRLDKEIKDEQLLMSERVSKIAINQEDLYTKNEYLKKKKACLKQYNSKLAEIQRQLLEKQQQMDIRRKDIIQILNSLAESKNKITKYRTQKENMQLRYKQVRQLIEDRTQEKIKLAKIEKQLKDKLNKIEIEKCKILQLKAEVEQQLQIDKTLTSERNNIIQKRKQKLEGKKSRLQLLEDMERDYEGFYRSVRLILDACKEDKELADKLCGVVAELIKVPKEYELAIETVLGSSLQYIVTEREEDAQYIIDFLRKNEYGRATFLPISSIRPRSLSAKEKSVLALHGCRGIASQLIEFNPKFSGIFKNLLGRVVVAETLNQAIDMAKKYSYTFKIVTLEGDITHPGGSISGGSTNKKSVSILGRKREISELKSVIVGEEESLNHEQCIVEEIVQKNMEKKLELSKYEKSIRELDLESIAEEEKLQHVTSECLKLDKELIAFKKEIEELDKELQHVECSIGKELKETEQLESQNLGIQEMVQTTDIFLKETMERKEELENQITDIRIEVASLEQEINSLNERIVSLESAVIRHKDNIQDKQNLIRSNLKDIDQYRNIIETKQQEVEHCDREMEKLSGMAKELEKEKNEYEEQIQAVEHGINEFTRIINEIIDKKHGFEVQLSRIEVELENLQNNIWEEYEVSYNIGLDYLDDNLTPSRINRKIQNIKESIEALGEVHVSSIEEYKRVKARYDFLKSQKQDLIDAQQDLNNIIRNITSLMKDKFNKEFKLINEHFNQVFSQLFGGGKAQLVLEDESDILECGIDIIAQPPGKKLQNLSLLSGGEKALTAIAILFAILRRKPTPFCVLDEIESALDEDNLENFGQFLKEFSQDTQFIVITHRKNTMEISDVLHGVAMEEKGVSKLVSVRLADKAS